MSSGEDYNTRLGGMRQDILELKSDSNPHMNSLKSNI